MRPYNPVVRDGVRELVGGSLLRICTSTDIDTGARAKAWCRLIHAEASLSNEPSTDVVFRRTESARLYEPSY